MAKKFKLFFAFWLVSGLIWLFAVARHIIVRNDVTGAIIYMIAAVASFILAFAYYKQY